MSENLEDFKKGFDDFKFSFDEDGFLNGCLIPNKIANCPCCGSQLEADITGWYQHQDGFIMPDEMSLDCIREGCYKEYKDSEFWRMPYVYWLPEEENAKIWIKAVIKKYHQLNAKE